MVVIMASAERSLPGAILLRYDPSSFPAIEVLLERLKERGDDIWVMLGTPQHKKKTGAFSRLNAARGWCRDIAEQLSVPEGEVSEEMVWEAMKRMAVGEKKWPTYLNAMDGCETPLSGEDASEENLGGMCDMIRLYAATNGLWLTEIVDGEKLRLTGGPGWKRE